MRFSSGLFKSFLKPYIFMQHIILLPPIWEEGRLYLPEGLKKHKQQINDDQPGLRVLRRKKALKLNRSQLLSVYFSDAF